MLKSISKKLVILCASLGPVYGQACATGDSTTMPLGRNYAGITSLPVARYLQIDDSCWGRSLTKIVLVASSDNGGMATLIANGKPVGVTQEIGSALQSYEFLTDPVENHLGPEIDIHSMEIRLSGNFFIDHIEAHFGPAVPPPDGDYWSHYGTLIWTTDLVGPQWTTITVLPGLLPAYSNFVFVARNGDFNIAHVILNLSDGTQKVYGAAYVQGNNAARISLAPGTVVSSFEIVGQSGTNTPANLEIRGGMDAFSIANSLAQTN